MDDMIDFPVSDTWRDHYAAQGLTYSSGRDARAHQRTLERIDRDLQALGEILTRLQHKGVSPPRSAPPPPQNLTPPYDGIDPLSP